MVMSVQPRVEPAINVMVRIIMPGLQLAPAAKEKGRRVRSSNKKVSERDTATDSDSSSTDQEVRRVESRDWPGTAKSAKPKLLSRVQAGEKKKKSRSDRWVTVYLVAVKVEF